MEQDWTRLSKVGPVRFVAFYSTLVMIKPCMHACSDVRISVSKSSP